MNGLREFLLERIADDEAAAQRVVDTQAPAYLHEDPWRALSGCVAKRLIIAAHRDVGPALEVVGSARVAPHACSTCGPYDEQGTEWPCYTLRVLALHWVDHPDYRNEWRPGGLRRTACR